MRGQSGATRTWTATRWLVLAALILGVVGVPTGADAATSWWTPTESLGSDQASIDEVEELVIAHDGRPLLLYTTGSSEPPAPASTGGDPVPAPASAVDVPDPAPAATAGTAQVRVRLQSSDGSWRAPTTLFDATSLDGLDARVVVAPDATYVVWTDTAEDQIEVAHLDGDTWTQLPALDLDGNPRHMDVALAPNGDVAVAWYRGGPNTAAFDGASWSPPTGIPLDASPSGLLLEVASDGTRVVAVHGTFFDDERGIRAYTVDGSGWSSPRRVSTPGAYFTFSTMVSSSNGVVLAFAERDGLGDPWNIRVAAFSSGTWSSTSTLATTRAQDGGLALAVAPDGTAHVAISRWKWNPQRAEIRTYRHNGGASWSPPELAVAIDNPAFTWMPDTVELSFGPEGTALVTAVQANFHTGHELVIGVRGPGKPWQQPGVLDNIGGAYGVHHAIDALGQLHVVWYSWEWWASSGVIMPFDDVDPGVFYSGPVLWAAHAGLTTGVGGRDEFQPNRSITRAEAITTLWRYHGEQSGPPSGFEDVAPNAFYTRAVNWARHTGLTTGVGGSNRFEPNRTITRAELVTLLWRLDGSRGAPSAGFADVAPGAFYARSVNWAKHTGITTGVGGSNRFEPNRDVTRAEAFTFVYRLARNTDVSVAGLDDTITETPFGSVDRLRPVALD